MRPVLTEFRATRPWALAAFNMVQRLLSVDYVAAKELDLRWQLRYPKARCPNFPVETTNCLAVLGLVTSRCNHHDPRRAGVLQFPQQTQRSCASHLRTPNLQHSGSQVDGLRRKACWNTTTLQLRLATPPLHAARARQWQVEQAVAWRPSRHIHCDPWAMRP